MHEATGTRRRRLSSEAQSAVRTAETGGYRLGTERERRKALVPLCVPPLRARRKRGKSHSSICGAKKVFLCHSNFPGKRFYVLRGNAEMQKTGLQSGQDIRFLDDRKYLLYSNSVADPVMAGLAQFRGHLLITSSTYLRTLMK